MQEVLVLDDEKNIRLMVRRSLEGIGLKVEEAVSGEEALRKLAEKSFSLLLLDLRLPGEDGMEILQEVRTTYPQLAVIIISAYGSIPLAVKALKAGARDFLEKPFTPQDLNQVVEQAIAR